MEATERTLEDFLNENLCTSLTEAQFQKRMQMGYQIIRGMSVLHESYKLIHRNLSLNSIHITSDGTLKIGELGLVAKSSEVFEDNHLTSRTFKRHLSYQVFPNINALKPPVKQEKPRRAIQKDNKRLFMAPEQGSKRMDSQKADIYSLGLILLVLLSPTINEKERAVIIKNCKIEGPPKKFVREHKELAKLIEQMVSIQKNIRPNIKSIMGHSLFRQLQKVTSKENNKVPIPQGESDKVLKGQYRMMLGKTNKWKTRYFHVDGKNLLIFKKKRNNKARLNYPLLECVIHIKEDLRKKYNKLLFKRSLSVSSISQARITENTDIVIVVIEHPEIVTMTLELIGTKKECADWLLYLRSSPLP